VKRVNIHDAKTNLSRYLAELTPGDTLVLCNRNQPVAELRSLRGNAARKPRIGVAKGKFAVPDSFFDPLPDEVLAAFNLNPADDVRRSGIGFSRWRTSVLPRLHPIGERCISRNSPALSAIQEFRRANCRIQVQRRVTTVRAMKLNPAVGAVEFQQPADS